MRTLHSAAWPQFAPLVLAAAMSACTVDKPADPRSVVRSAGPVPSAARGVTRSRPGEPAIFDITVNASGFTPARLEVEPNQPVILRVTRVIAETCADAIDIQGDPVRHPLPLGQMVEVKFTAPSSGEVAFACPMNMLRGAAFVVR